MGECVAVDSVAGLGDLLYLSITLFAVGILGLNVMPAEDLARSREDMDSGRDFRSILLAEKIRV